MPGAVFEPRYPPKHRSLPLDCRSNRRLDTVVNVFGCGVDDRGEDGWTACHCASDEGHESALRVLVTELHADPWATDMDGDMPLHQAATEGHESVVRFLLDERSSNISVDQANYHGTTVLHCACSGGHLRIVENLLMKYNASTTARDSKMNLPLHLAVNNGHTSVVEFFVNTFGVVIQTNLKGYCGRTPLHQACSTGNSELLRLLMVTDPPVDDDGNSLVHIAVMGGQRGIVSDLIEDYGLPTNFVNHKQQLVLRYLVVLPLAITFLCLGGGMT